MAQLCGVSALDGGHAGAEAGPCSQIASDDVAINARMQALAEVNDTCKRRFGVLHLRSTIAGRDCGGQRRQGQNNQGQTNPSGECSSKMKSQVQEVELVPEVVLQAAEAVARTLTTLLRDQARSSVADWLAS